MNNGRRWLIGLSRCGYMSLPNHALERPNNQRGPRLAAAQRSVVGRSTSR